MGATERLLLVILLVTATTMARADDRAGASVFVHSDDDGLTVVHPAASVRAAIGDDDHVTVRYDADVVSAATVDVRTSASPRGFEETRHGGGVAVEHDLSRTLHLAGGYGFSWSEDYETHATSASLSIEDDTRSRTVTVGVSGAVDVVGRAGDLEPVGHVGNLAATASFSWLLSDAAIGDVTGALEWRTGYLESPYRFVPIESASGQSEVSVAEEVPDSVVRGALRARLRYAPLSWLFLRGSYRFHLDDWGIAGHTVRIRAAVEPADGWLVWLGGRFHGQRAASFYQGRYTTLPAIPRYRTRDRELAHGFYVAVAAGVAVELFQIDGFLVRADARGELVETRYFDTPVLRDRTAFTVGLGLSVER